MKEIKVKVPEGITEFSVNINGETATVVYETRTEETGKKEERQPQDGEIIFAETSAGCQHFIFPYCHMEQVVLHDIKGKFELGLDGPIYIYKSFRPATEEEKKMLNDALKEKGLRWNEEEKKVEKMPRWRANCGKKFFFIDENTDVQTATEGHSICDDNLYIVSNYFKTEEAAERVAEQVREIFRKSKKE